MRPWLPFPFISAGLLIIWLLINQSLAPAHLLLGGVLAVSIPWLLRRLQPLPAVRVSRPMALLRLLSMALVEIVRSCFNVSRIILFVKAEGLESRFIHIPLDLRNPYGLALLSCLINSTPGTVWVEILPEGHQLVLHVFDLHDEQWWIDTIKQRYERPLIEVFEGGINS